jgi:hypothetical protein
MVTRQNRLTIGSIPQANLRSSIDKLESQISETESQLAEAQPKLKYIMHQAVYLFIIY